MNNADGPRFILWDPRDGALRRDAGEIVSDGVIGRIGPDNCYLTAYAEWPVEITLDGRSVCPSYRELEVGQAIHGVVYRLGGQKGVYDVYRVR